jgi:hypothetical protein
LPTSAEAELNVLVIEPAGQAVGSADYFCAATAALPLRSRSILVTAGDRRDARHHHFEHLVPDAARIAAIRHRIGKPPAHPKLALGLPQEQQTAVRGLAAAVKIDCEFLAMNRWQLKRKQRIVVYGGLWRSADTRCNLSEQQFAT